MYERESFKQKKQYNDLNKEYRNTQAGRTNKTYRNRYTSTSKKQLPSTIISKWMCEDMFNEFTKVFSLNNKFQIQYNPYFYNPRNLTLKVPIGQLKKYATDLGLNNEEDFIKIDINASVFSGKKLQQTLKNYNEEYVLNFLQDLCKYVFCIFYEDTHVKGRIYILKNTGIVYIEYLTPLINEDEISDGGINKKPICISGLFFTGEYDYQ